MKTPTYSEIVNLVAAIEGVEGVINDTDAIRIQVESKSSSKLVAYELESLRAQYAGDIDLEHVHVEVGG